MNRNVRRRTKQELINHTRFRTVTLLDGYTFRRATDLLSGLSYGFAHDDGMLYMEHDAAQAAADIRAGIFTAEPEVPLIGRVKY